MYQLSCNGTQIVIHGDGLLVAFEILKLIFQWSLEMTKIHDLCFSLGWWSSLFCFYKGILMVFKMRLDRAQLSRTHHQPPSASAHTLLLQQRHVGSTASKDWGARGWAGLGRDWCPTGFQCLLSSQGDRAHCQHRALLTASLTHPVAHQLPPLLFTAINTASELRNKREYLSWALRNAVSALG